MRVFSGNNNAQPPLFYYKFSFFFNVIFTKSYAYIVVCHYFDEGQLFLTYFIHGLKYKCKQT